MAKRAGRVGFGLGQSGRGSKRVIFKQVNRIMGQTGCGSNRSGQTGLTHFAMSTHEMLRASRENIEGETLKKNKINLSTIFT